MAFNAAGRGIAGILRNPQAQKFASYSAGYLMNASNMDLLNAQSKLQQNDHKLKQDLRSTYQAVGIDRELAEKFVGDYFKYLKSMDVDYQKIAVADAGVGGTISSVLTKSLQGFSSKGLAKGAIFAVGEIGKEIIYSFYDETLVNETMKYAVAYDASIAEYVLSGKINRSDALLMSQILGEKLATSQYSNASLSNKTSAYLRSESQLSGWLLTASMMSNQTQLNERVAQQDVDLKEFQNRLEVHGYYILQNQKSIDAVRRNLAGNNVDEENIKKVIYESVDIADPILKKGFEECLAAVILEIEAFYLAPILEQQEKMGEILLGLSLEVQHIKKTLERLESEQSKESEFARIKLQNDIKNWQLITAALLAFANHSGNEYLKKAAGVAELLSTQAAPAILTFLEQGALATVAGIAGLAMCALNIAILLFTKPGPSFETIVLQQLAELRQQLQSLQQSIDAHFVIVNDKLDKLYRDLSSGFEAVLETLVVQQAFSHRHFEKIEAELSYLSNRLNAFGNALWLRPLRKVCLEIDSYETRHQGDFSQLDSDTYNRYMNKLIIWLIGESTDSLSTGQHLAIGHKNDFEILQTVMHTENLQYLSGFLQQLMKDSYQLNLTNESILYNPALWYKAMQYYLKLYQKAPKAIVEARDPAQSEVQKLKIAAKRILNFYGSVQQNSHVFSKCLDDYWFRVDELSRLYIASVEYLQQELLARDVVSEAERSVRQMRSSEDTEVIRQLDTTIWYPLMFYHSIHILNEKDIEEINNWNSIRETHLQPFFEEYKAALSAEVALSKNLRPIANFVRIRARNIDIDLPLSPVFTTDQNIKVVLPVWLLQAERFGIGMFEFNLSCQYLAMDQASFLLESGFKIKEQTYPVFRCILTSNQMNHPALVEACDKGFSSSGIGAISIPFQGHTEPTIERMKLIWGWLSARNIGYEYDPNLSQLETLLKGQYKKVFDEYNTNTIHQVLAAKNNVPVETNLDAFRNAVIGIDISYYLLNTLGMIAGFNQSVCQMLHTLCNQESIYRMLTLQKADEPFVEVMASHLGHNNASSKGPFSKFNQVRQAVMTAVMPTLSSITVPRHPTQFSIQRVVSYFEEKPQSAETQNEERKLPKVPEERLPALANLFNRVLFEKREERYQKGKEALSFQSHLYESGVSEKRFNRDNIEREYAVYRCHSSQTDRLLMMQRSEICQVLTQHRSELEYYWLEIVLALFFNSHRFNSLSVYDEAAIEKAHSFQEKADRWIQSLETNYNLKLQSPFSYFLNCIVENALQGRRRSKFRVADELFSSPEMDVGRNKGQVLFDEITRWFTELEEHYSKQMQFESYLTDYLQEENNPLGWFTLLYLANYRNNIITIFTVKKKEKKKLEIIVENRPAQGVDSSLTLTLFLHPSLLNECCILVLNKIVNLNPVLAEERQQAAQQLLDASAKGDLEGCQQALAVMSRLNCDKSEIAENEKGKKPLAPSAKMVLPTTEMELLPHYPQQSQDLFMLLEWALYKGGLTPLMLAAREGHLHVVRYMIDFLRENNSASEITKQNHFSLTALDYATIFNHFECINVLIPRYQKDTLHFIVRIAEIACAFDYQRVFSAAHSLFLSCDKGYYKLMCIEEYGEKIFQVCTSIVLQGDLTSLKYVQSHVYKGTFDKIIHMPCAYSIESEQGERLNITFLMLAAWCGHANIVEYLLTLGVNPDSALEGYYTPLMLTLYNDRVDAFSLLLQCSSNVDNEVLFGLLLRLGRKAQKIIQFLHHASFAQVNSTALAGLACEKGCVEVLEILFAAGLHYTVQDEKGHDLLTIARRSKQQEIIKRIHFEMDKVRVAVNKLEYSSLERTIDKPKELKQKNLSPQDCCDVFDRCFTGEFSAIQPLLTNKMAVTVQHPYHQATLLHAAIIQRSGVHGFARFDLHMIENILRLYLSHNVLLDMLQVKITADKRNRINWQKFSNLFILDLDNYLDKTAYDYLMYYRYRYFQIEWPEVSGQFACPQYQVRVASCQESLKQLDTMLKLFQLALAENIVLELQLGFPRFKFNINEAKTVVEVSIDFLELRQVLIDQLKAIERNNRIEIGINQLTPEMVISVVTEIRRLSKIYKAQLEKKLNYVLLDQRNECYDIFNVSREQVFNLLHDHFFAIKELLLLSTINALYDPLFLIYLKQLFILNEDKIEQDAVVNYAGKLEVILAYLLYDIRDQRTDNGWSYAHTLIAVSELLHITLNLWEKDDKNNLVPYKIIGHENKQKHAREMDIVFSERNHFCQFQWINREKSVHQASSSKQKSVKEQSNEHQQEITLFKFFRLEHLPRPIMKENKESIALSQESQKEKTSNITASSSGVSAIVVETPVVTTRSRNTTLFAAGAAAVVTVAAISYQALF